MNRLIRRGFKLGYKSDKKTAVSTCTTELQTKAYAAGYPVKIEQLCSRQIGQYLQCFERTENLVLGILHGHDGESLLDDPFYQEQLSPNFALQGSSINEGDDQEIETVFFEGLSDGTLVAENLWMKVSWLSFFEEDSSLRFRFSFGVDHVEDVAADAQRQHYAAQLCDAVFPESAIITQNEDLQNKLRTILSCDDIHFVERIVYFNSPNGGAYLHHDFERGHAGVVFAQLSGSTFWLALPKSALLSEINDFVKAAQWPDSIKLEAQDELIALANDEQALARELDSFANSALIHLINETEPFVQQLIKNGHGRELMPGDVLLLPQERVDACCWHSVFCLGEETGQALSFAIRTS